MNIHILFYRSRKDSKKMEKVEMSFDETDQIKTEKVVYIETIDKAISASNYHPVAEISQAERKLIRKIDLMIMPFICVVGFLQFMDKTAVAYGAVLGMIQDINLQGSQYSLLSSLFYVGYLCMQVNSSLFFNYDEIIHQCLIFVDI